MGHSSWLVALAAGLCCACRSPCRVDSGQAATGPCLARQNSVLILNAPGSLADGIAFEAGGVRYGEHQKVWGSTGATNSWLNLGTHPYR